MFGDIIGAVLGNRADKKAQSKQDDWNWRAYGLAKDQFREVQDKTIQNRVADAKAAGIHPLYGLGLPGASSADFIPGQVPTGNALAQGLSRAADAAVSYVGNRHSRKLARQRVSNETRITNAEINQANAQATRDLAEAQLMRSRAMRETLNANRTQDTVKTKDIVPDVHPHAPKAQIDALPREPAQHSRKGGGSLEAWGGKVRVPRKMSEAEDWQKWYGEPGEWIGGISNLFQTGYEAVHGDPELARARRAWRKVERQRRRYTAKRKIGSRRTMGKEHWRR